MKRKVRQYLESVQTQAQLGALHAAALVETRAILNTLTGGELGHAQRLLRVQSNELPAVVVKVKVTWPKPPKMTVEESDALAESFRQEMRLSGESKRGE